MTANAENETPFGLPTARITIKSADVPTAEFEVKAQFNPKELEIKRTVPWSKPAETSKKNQKTKQEPGIHLEFTGAESRTMTIELLFDGYEEKAGDTFFIEDVTKEVAKLEKLASVRDASANAKEELRRPHLCMVTWGETFGKGFSCVIDSLSTKYTMFASDGRPLRATCTVSLKEANFLALAKKK